MSNIFNHGAIIREQQRVDGEDVWVVREITNADLKQLPYSRKVTMEIGDFIKT
jgi:hypothetical protein